MPRRIETGGGGFEDPKPFEEVLRGYASTRGLKITMGEGGSFLVWRGDELVGTFRRARVKEIRSGVLLEAKGMAFYEPERDQIQASVVDPNSYLNFIEQSLMDLSEPETVQEAPEPVQEAPEPEKPSQIEELYLELTKSLHPSVRKLVCVLWHKVSGYKRKGVQGLQTAIYSYANLNEAEVITNIKNEIMPKRQIHLDNFLEALEKERPR